MHERTVAPRVLGAIAAGLAVTITTWVERQLGYKVTAEEHAAVLGVTYAVAQLVYAFVHRRVSRAWNPDDVAKAGKLGRRY